MASAKAQAKSSLFESYILPVLLIYLIPGFSLWFFSGAETQMDREILEHVVAQVRSVRNIDPAEKEWFLNFLSEVPVSEILASDSPNAVKLQPMFASFSERYIMFRWLKRLAWFCLATIAVTFVIVGLSVACSFKSYAAQYYSLRIGWSVLRIAAVVQVLGQAVLAVALSYWVTAIMMRVYIVEVIVVVGLLAACAVIALLNAIFTRVDDHHKVGGTLISENHVPALWQRVRGMAARLQTAAPDRIIAGIEPRFFVTEHPVVFGSERYEGRTLYVSLPMLKLMAGDEADAVLGHELAHFSGQDTLWFRKIAPLTGRFASYLQALGEGPSVVVAQFMLPFWSLYSLSIHQLGREREFRADRIGAELVSMDAMKRALVKTTCYCEYRAEAERTILKSPRVAQTRDLAYHLERGYPAFLSAFTRSDAAIEQRVPHPFDTHPTLNNRLADLGFNAAATMRDARIQEPVRNPWYEAIASVPLLEEQMWKHWQESLQSYSVELAGQLTPNNEEETEIVRAHFPDRVFRMWNGIEAVLEFDRLTIGGSDASIMFKDIVGTSVDDVTAGKQLTLTHNRRGSSKPTTTTILTEAFVGGKGEDLLTSFEKYYSRHRTAGVKQWRAGRRSAGLSV